MLNPKITFFISNMSSRSFSTFTHDKNIIQYLLISFFDKGDLSVASFRMKIKIKIKINEKIHKKLINITT